MNQAVVPRILLVDDAPDIHALVGRYLQSTGIDLSHAYTGSTGLEEAVSKRPDLILLDYDLPDMNGLETLKTLRKSHEGRLMPVVFLTSNDDQKLIAAAFAEGAVDFLRKPIFPIEFQARIKSVLKTQALLHRLRFLSHNDPLTGLPNRNGMCQWIEHANQHPADYQTPYAALAIGIDRISTITDLMGYGASEELLRAVARRLQTILSQSAQIDRCCTRKHLARGAGDAFVLLLSGVDGMRSIMNLATSLVESVASAYKIGHENQFVSASVGVAISRDPEHDFHDLIRCADIALQDAKRAGRSHVQLYDASMEDVLRRRQALENDLRIATRNRAFQLNYQPVINLQTWQFDSVETIIRWDHPETGDIPIQRFKPIAEENGLMGEINNWALSNACMQLSQWIYESPSDSPRRISLNISRRELMHPRFLELALETIHQTRLRADRVQFEILESEINLESSGTFDVLRKLREAGVRVLVDEFGTAFPSFNYMEQFPVDGIKLNRLLIQDLETNSYVPKLLEMIMRQAAELSLTVVVDGVERETQAKSLNNLGYRWAQGDLFSRPIAGEAMMPFLANWNINLRNKSRTKPTSRENTPGTLAT